MSSFLQLIPDRASSMAGSVDLLYLYLVVVSGFFSIAIALCLLVFAIRYRRRSEDERPEAIHGSMLLEITWSVVPLGLTMIMFFWGVDLFFRMNRPPADAMEMFVTGKQWMWKIQHPEGRREINELHVPMGRAVKLTMSSEDVIHSFYVPAFRVKMDVLPGRYTSLWFEATRVGTYHLFCAEYCGTVHSGMIGWVTVMGPAEYESWLAGGPAAPSMVSAGEQLFADLGCTTCHKAGEAQRGPELEGVFGSKVRIAGGQVVTADEGYVRESIVNPNAKVVEGFPAIMPTFQGMVTEEQLIQLVAYVKALRSESGGKQR